MDCNFIVILKAKDNLYVTYLLNVLLFTYSPLKGKRKTIPITGRGGL
jgi:hypothetical protein